MARLGVQSEIERKPKPLEAGINPPTPISSGRASSGISKVIHMAPKVLVSDKLSETAVQIFRDRGIEWTFEPDLGKDKDKLLSVIGDYDGLAIRSATKVTRKFWRRRPT